MTTDEPDQTPESSQSHDRAQVRTAAEPHAHPPLGPSDLWHRVSQAAGLVGPTGEVGGTVYAQMTALATATGAVNLGQGAPGTNPAPVVVEAAAAAMRAGVNQYSPAQGHPALIDAVCAQRQRAYATPVHPDHVLITVGATEAITAAVLALVPTGGTVIVFEPFYDSYAAAAALAGATLAPVPLLPPDQQSGQFRPDLSAFEAALAQAASGPGSAVILNAPHNPTGFVFSDEQLVRIHDLAQAADSWIITDEVYEHLTYEGTRFTPMAAVTSGSPRVVTVSSAGKTFNVTGWKIGWVIADPQVRAAIQAVKQYLTFVGGAPFQPAIAKALGNPQLARDTRDSLDARRAELLAPLLSAPGITATRAEAGYFTLVDFSQVSELGAFELNERIGEHYGIVGIPVPGLCRAGSSTAQVYAHSIRYSFCKAPAENTEAAARFATMRDDLKAGRFLAR